MSLLKDLYGHQTPPPHPGEVLREDILPLVQLSRAAMARHLGISARTLADIVHERRPVTLDVARRLGAAFGCGTHYWLGLQMQHDLWRARISEPVAIKPIYTSRPRGARQSLPAV